MLCAGDVVQLRSHQHAATCFTVLGSKHKQRLLTATFSSAFPAIQTRYSRLSPTFTHKCSDVNAMQTLYKRDTLVVLNDSTWATVSQRRNRRRELLRWDFLLNCHRSGDLNCAMQINTQIKAMHRPRSWNSAMRDCVAVLCIAPKLDGSVQRSSDKRPVERLVAISRHKSHVTTQRGHIGSSKFGN